MRVELSTLSGKDGFTITIDQIEKLKFGGARY